MHITANLEMQGRYETSEPALCIVNCQLAAARRPLTSPTQRQMQDRESHRGGIHGEAG